MTAVAIVLRALIGAERESVGDLLCQLNAYSTETVSAVYTVSISGNGSEGSRWESGGEKRSFAVPQSERASWRHPCCKVARRMPATRDLSRLPAP